MHVSDSPNITDWFAVSLHWLFLLGGVTAISIGGSLLVQPNLLLVGWVCWNIALTVVTGLNARFRFHRQICLGMDLLLASAYFVLAGGFANPAFWLVFLPMATAALYFEMRGALVSAALVAVVQVSATAYQTLAVSALMIAGASALVTFGIAGVFGYAGTQLFRTIRKHQQAQQEAQQRKLRVENERLRAIYSLTSTLTATLNYQRVLESVLDLSLSALNTDVELAADDRLLCAVLLFSKDEALEVGSARRLPPADRQGGSAAALGIGVCAKQGTLSDRAGAGGYGGRISPAQVAAGRDRPGLAHLA